MQAYFTEGHEEATLEYIRSIVVDYYDFAIQDMAFEAHSDKFVCVLTTTAGEKFNVFVYYSVNGLDYEHFKYKRHESILQEVAFLQAVARETDVLVPVPQVNRKGEFLTPIYIPSCNVVTSLMVVSFIEGRPMDPADEDYVEKCFHAGVCSAKLHQVSRKHYADFKTNHRPIHRHGWVIQIRNDIRRGLPLGTVSPEDFDVICEGLDYIDSVMTKLDSVEGSRGFVHTDLRAANFINTGNNVAPIDFSRTVYGYLLYDLGEMCAHMGGDDVGYAIMQGYTSITPLTEVEMHFIEAFFILFVLSVIGEKTELIGNEYVQVTTRRWVDELIPALLAKEPIFKRIRETIQ